MNGDDPGVRALPRTVGDGRPCYLSTDGTGPVSRLANRIEAVQLGLAGRVLGQGRNVLAECGPAVASELRFLCAQLVDALDDALFIAESRRLRLASADEEEKDEEESGVVPVELQASVLASLPGGELASACVARRFVRDMARSWRLPREAADVLEAVTGELVANALEHSKSRFLGVELARTGAVMRVGVRDEGKGWAAIRQGPPAEQEHGRGLLIVAAMSERWGQDTTDDGHTVWAEVAVGGSAEGGAP
ncbi:ATP-binding protein [Streptomyces natalensis]|uniref:ATP-binding protein n=1 Tax=Streptomyces natalensis TaxID=68242 RepID=UPI0006993CCD|nr:ATP-binding protein [Streptomyces natalensis]